MKLNSTYRSLAYQRVLYMAWQFGPMATWTFPC